MPIHATDTLWILETNRTGYAFGLNRDGLLTHCYWGARLPDPADYPAPAEPLGWASFNNPAHLAQEEYPGYEEMKFADPCLMVTFADGVRGTVLQAQITCVDQPRARIQG